MPRLNRSEICASDEVQAFHLINRCVRRTYLCGQDRQSGKDFSHRKQWIRDRLEELAGIVGIDILGYAVMSNHLHVIARTRPDVVKGWPDDEIALRWWRLFPQRREKDHSPSEPTEFELKLIRNDKTGLAEKRRRLSDVSWLMRCLAEPIARRGNKEDEVTGRFWEGRFRAQPLLDETAIAACMAYVDLNPIRATIATTAETSDFTSVKDRIEDRQSAAEVSTSDAQDVRIEQGSKAGWLSPLALEPPRKKVREKQSARRASNLGCLPMALDDYLKLIDWTGRQYHKDKPGKIPADCLPILKRLQCDAETWLDWVRNFRLRFRREVGLPTSRQSFKADLKNRRSQLA
jgi:REP element-mobilizing transposase RayT